MENIRRQWEIKDHEEHMEMVESRKKQEAEMLSEINALKVEKEIDGISLYKSLLGQKQDTNNRVVYFMRREGGSYAGMCYYAMIQGEYKLLQNTPFEPLELFNLKNDPVEKIPMNINSEKFNELRYNLSQHIRKSGNIPWQNEK